MEKLTWEKSIILGSLSVILIVILYIKPLTNIFYSGEKFAYNIILYIPILILSITFEIIGFVHFTRYIDVRETSKGRKAIFKVLAPLLLLVPAAFHLIVFMILFVYKVLS